MGWKMRKDLFSLCASLAVFICLINFAVITNAWAVSGQAAATSIHPLFTTNTGQTIAVGDGIIVKFKATTSITNQLNALKSSGCSSNTSFRLVGNLTHARITSSRSLSQTLALLRANPAVEYAEPNAILSAAAIPNDPQFVNLFGLDNNGQTGGVVDADIDAPQAWDIATGSNTIIAVVDSGLDYNHIDIQGNVWLNTTEIANNGIDDDGNGYIDDVRGWNFFNNDNDPMDDSDHGTHVAGTIAAVGNNGVGVTGVNWSARIMGLKFMNATGTGSTSDAIAAIDYAVANGARVINASWGGPFFSTALSDAITAANAAGVLFVSAAGNNGTNNDTAPNFPASYDIPNIISVAATDANDALPLFSNFGLTSVDLGAPGIGILSTVRANGYASLSGTSMASPHVAGAAGLALSLDPNLTVVELKNAILNNVDSVISLIGRTVTGGRLNVFNMLNSINPNPVPPPPVDIIVSPNTASVPVQGNIQFSATSTVPTASYIWSVDNNAIGSISSASGLFTALAPGTVVITATDAANNFGISGDINVVQVQITPTSALLYVGASQPFVASNGFPPYIWTSSDPAIASIDSLGLLAALAAGTVNVSVVDDVGSTATISNIVIAQPQVDPQTAFLATNDVLQFTASNGVAPYTWSSTNTTIATIDTTGLLTALAPGTTIVTATDANNTMASTDTIMVRTISVSSPVASVDTSGNIQFTASGGGSQIYSWSSSNTAVATIDPTTGLLTANATTPGNTIITATDTDGISGSSGPITITPPPPPPPATATSVTPLSVTLSVGETAQITASGGTVASYTWSSSNASIATINATNDVTIGLLTAIAAGTSAYSIADGTTTSSGTVTITQTQITPNSAFLGINQTLSLSASGGGAPYTWSSNNPSIASIDSTSGVLTALSVGTVIISTTDRFGEVATTGNIVISDINIAPQTATLNISDLLTFTVSGGNGAHTWVSSNPTIASIGLTTGILTAHNTGTITITATDVNNISGSTLAIDIVSPPPPTITVTTPATTLDIGASLSLTATGSLTSYTWSVSDPAVASIGITSGVLTGLSAGTVTVTATDADSFTGVSVPITVINPTVPALPPQIQPQTSLLAVTDTVQFSVANGEAPFTWSTSNQNTNITSINATTIQLSATATATTTVTVTDAQNISATTGTIEFRAISVSSPFTSIDIGATLQMTATGGLAPYTWAINDPAIATIGPAGVLSGVATGNVTVTATDADNFTGSTLITIVSPAANITVFPQTATLPVGDTLSFSVNNAFGHMGRTGALIWSSSNPAVATVSTVGVLTAVDVGTTIITVSDGVGNFGTSGTITINPPPPVAITPQTVSVTAGNWLQFFATGGTGTYTWSSSDPAIATIDLNGWLFGVAEGTVSVTATDSATGSATTGIITITPGGMHR